MYNLNHFEREDGGMKLPEYSHVQYISTQNLLRITPIINSIQKNFESMHLIIDISFLAFHFCLNIEQFKLKQSLIILV